jgi:hypothetical protein
LKLYGERKDRRAELRERTMANARRDAVMGIPDSENIWLEMLAEMD